MKVIRAKVLGFCMGVQHAVDLTVEEACRASKNRNPIYTLGPLIHNPKVLNDLRKLGVEEITEIPKDGKCSVVIRAHGIPPNVEMNLRDAGCYLVDATCPNVKASQIKAEELVRQGYFLFLAGEASHAEIESIMGYAVGLSAFDSCIVVKNEQEAKKTAKKQYAVKSDVKTALIGQTTMSEAEYKKIAEGIRLFFPNLEIIQTICNATMERQDALRDLLRQVDAVIVAGGKESANTKRLLEIAKESKKPGVLVENADEIPEEFRHYETVGLCAGASTPNSIIDEIEEELRKNTLV